MGDADLALIIRKDGGYDIYRTIDRESWPLLTEELVILSAISVE